MASKANLRRAQRATAAIEDAVVVQPRVSADDRAPRHRDGRGERAFRGQPVAAAQLPLAHEPGDAVGEARRERGVGRRPASQAQRQLFRRDDSRALVHQGGSGSREGSYLVILVQ